jgi:PadR family transcriptional regulator, regulatory protein AphA
MAPRLGPSSYVILGVLSLAGPQTPYGIKQAIGRTVGYYWPFPHAQLYKETARLALLGLASETLEPAGRRRRTYGITETGRSALHEWLVGPTEEPAQFRDLGLLKLAFSSGADVAVRQVLQRDQLAAHQERLRAYEEYAQIPMDAALRETLELGIRYERVAVEFWRDLALNDGSRT